ncbi:hypothetical protein MHPYR_70052 [uncultured Mycobacterium sp.]|uniref:Uncharacterized protein n=1 Tax=uncultured Mycobacterium sp. TaxID=171292 RepID=A0A1Y5PSJ0_9MYCO|nr:hypothetical protein MHPYR_70052 [uncultured Mycobacterium sp.]
MLPTVAAIAMLHLQMPVGSAAPEPFFIRGRRRALPVAGRRRGGGLLWLTHRPMIRPVVSQALMAGGKNSL